ncbi:MAG: DNA cytosine methyltransferase, partial [Acidimicrobiia bacterium]
MFDLWSTLPADEPGRIDRVTARGVAVSLFSGAGGLDLGVEASGFVTTAAVELDEDAADTMEKNFSGLVSPV